MTFIRCPRVRLGRVRVSFLLSGVLWAVLGLLPAGVGPVGFPLGGMGGAPGASALSAQVPTPLDHFGHEIGADRELADWESLLAYYDRVAAASPRIQIDTLGTTTRGRHFVRLTVSAPENMERLEELREINQMLADPRRIRDEAHRRELLEAGKAVVMITNHIHSFEVGSGQMPASLLYRLATSDEPRMAEILENVVLVMIPSLNPDGTQYVADWWNRWKDTEFESAPLPWLYHWYVGHDNNRDWYSIRQVETELTVRHAHNHWRPHIVQDHHQLWADNLRIWVPPYQDPWEPNIDPALVGAANQLGKYVAAELLAEGKSGVGTYSIFDAFTPARAYQHHHGGVRILVEVARADWAAPVNLTPDDLSARRGADPHAATWNHPRPWPGGEWGIGDIVEYMESASMAVLTHAARNREYWVRNFHGIQQRAVEGWDRWPSAWILPHQQPDEHRARDLIRILRLGDVEVYDTEDGWAVPMDQPFASFAQALLERQEYPDLRLYPGGPPQTPYDVTAHTLPLLMGVDAVPVEGQLDGDPSQIIPVPEPVTFPLPPELSGPDAPRVGVFKGWGESQPSGWTRWTLDRHELDYDTLMQVHVRDGSFRDEVDVVLFQDRSPASIVEGYSPEVIAEPYAGGIGREGLEHLRAFVEEGGRLVAVESAADLLIDLFALQVGREGEGAEATDFFVPGSILRLNLEDHPFVAGLEVETVAWFRGGGGGGGSRAFTVDDPRVEVLARYGEHDPLLSGWLMGPEYVAGGAALLRVPVGEGELVLFGFQPDYRGQSSATWPLLLRALGGAGAPTGGGGGLDLP
jgi:hypothetical protein